MLMRKFIDLGARLRGTTSCRTRTLLVAAKTRTVHRVMRKRRRCTMRAGNCTSLRQTKRVQHVFLHDLSNPVRTSPTTLVKERHALLVGSPSHATAKKVVVKEYLPPALSKTFDVPIPAGGR